MKTSRISPLNLVTIITFIMYTTKSKGWIELCRTNGFKLNKLLEKNEPMKFAVEASRKPEKDRNQRLLLSQSEARCAPFVLTWQRYNTKQVPMAICKTPISVLLLFSFLSLLALSLSLSHPHKQTHV